MINALRQDGHTLRLVGETISIEVTDTVWSFQLQGQQIFHATVSDRLPLSNRPYPVTGTSSTEIGPIVGKREQAISYILEDACIHFGILANRRIERNAKPTKQTPEDRCGNMSAYSSGILKEFRSNYAGELITSGEASKSQSGYSGHPSIFLAPAQRQ